MAETVYLLLGSNVGDRERNLELALRALTELEGFEITATSSIYVSEAREMKGENPSFLNQVVKGDFQYPALELLHSLEQIEVGLGRTDKGMKQARTIDCDILLFGNHIIKNEKLTVPHPRLLDRPFVMVPLLEIDPQLTHPTTRNPIASYLSERDRRTVLLFREHVARNV